MGEAAFDLQALYAALDERRRARGLSWAAVTREVNARFRDVRGHKPLAASTITGLRTRALAEGDGVLQLLLWLGRTPESFVPGCETTPSQVLRSDLATTQILRWDARALHAAIDRKRTALGLSWKETAGQIGDGDAAGLARLSRGGRVALPGVMRIALWLGEPAARFTRASDW
jgi:hypothetical protein